MKLAQEGLPEIAKVSVRPYGPDAVGAKLYGWPEGSEVGGVPEMDRGSGQCRLTCA